MGESRGPSPQRRAIQQAALGLFARRGYHGASMQAIARAVGLSKGTLYWHFASKEELFRSVYQDFIQEMIKPLERALEGPEPPEFKLRYIVEKSLAQAQEQADSLRVLFQLIAQQELADTVTRLVAEEMAQWVAAIAPLFAALGTPDPPATARLFVAAVDGLMSHVLVDPHMVQETDVLSAITRCFLLPKPPL